MLGDTWSTSCSKQVIFLVVNPKFVYLRINLILKDNSKAKAKTLSVYENNGYFFIYDIRAIDLGKFSNPGICNVNTFWSEIKVAVKLQIYSCNFKTKRQEKNLGYFIKLMRLYKLEDVKILPTLTSKKRQKEANEFIVLPPKTKNTPCALN